MRLRRRDFLCATGLTLCLGCDSVTIPSSQVLAWGGPGKRIGEFRRPRAIGTFNDEVYVIDKAGRVQVFNEDGEFVRHWLMPSSENGTPTCVSFSTQGTVLIPDTHYSAIREYSTEGELIRSWGTYGSGIDEFIYPTGIIEASDDRFYISEYGQEAERVHVCGTDGSFIETWGTFGEGEREFNRAMDIVLGKNEELLIVDSGNHRIQRLNTAGEYLGEFGGVGSGPGQLEHPFDAAATPDGRIVAVEYGTCRLSVFSAQGEFIAHFGGLGRIPGRFAGPRGVAVSDSGYVFVADTDNDRVQRFSLEDVA